MLNPCVNLQITRSHRFVIIIVPVSATLFLPNSSRMVAEPHSRRQFSLTRFCNLISSQFSRRFGCGTPFQMAILINKVGALVAEPYSIYIYVYGNPCGRGSATIFVLNFALSLGNSRRFGCRTSFTRIVIENRFQQPKISILIQ